jgi:signal transduction histidine kinase
MEDTDWLLMLSEQGVVEAVDGGAPQGWVARRVDDCVGLPEAVRSAARRLRRGHAQPLTRTLLRRERVPSGAPGAPSFTLIAVEAIPIRPNEVPLAPLIREALAPLGRQAAKERVSLELDLSDEPHLVAAVDADKIAWALTALVGNALRYVRRGDGVLPGGYVHVRASRSPSQEMININVQDDGPGIPVSLRPWLLEPDPATGRAAGVGLRLVHDIVVAHGGGMVIKSNAEPSDRGTTVTLWLPLRA